MKTIDLDQLSTVTGAFDGGEMSRAANRNAFEGAKIGALVGAPFWLFPIIPMGTALAGGVIGYAGGAAGNAISQLRRKPSSDK